MYPYVSSHIVMAVSRRSIPISVELVGHSLRIVFDSSDELSDVSSSEFVVWILFHYGQIKGLSLVCFRSCTFLL